MARSITVIPARANRPQHDENIETSKKRVAAYCRFQQTKRATLKL
jgi:hypothetical protein